MRHFDCRAIKSGLVVPWMLLVSLSSAEISANAKSAAKIIKNKTEGWTAAYSAAGGEHSLKFNTAPGTSFIYKPEDATSSLVEQRLLIRKSGNSLLLTKWLRGKSEALVVFEPARKAEPAKPVFEQESEGAIVSSWDDKQQRLNVTYMYSGDSTFGARRTIAPKVVFWPLKVGMSDEALRCRTAIQNLLPTEIVDFSKARNPELSRLAVKMKSVASRIIGTDLGLLPNSLLSTANPKIYQSFYVTSEGTSIRIFFFINSAEAGHVLNIGNANQYSCSADL